MQMRVTRKGICIYEIEYPNKLFPKTRSRHPLVHCKMYISCAAYMKNTYEDILKRVSFILWLSINLSIRFIAATIPNG